MKRKSESLKRKNTWKLGLNENKQIEYTNKMIKRNPY